MSELTLQWIQGLKLLTILVCAMLYGFGGMHGKWKRRFVAPGVYVAAMSALALWAGTFHWSILTLYLGYCIPIGYGGTTVTWVKVVKRAWAAVPKALAPILLVIMTGVSPALMAFHVALCITASILLGAFNPTKSARAEETTIAACYYLLPILTMV